jgi:hypothetical protein
MADLATTAMVTDKGVSSTGAPPRHAIPPTALHAPEFIPTRQFMGEIIGRIELLEDQITVLRGDANLAAARATSALATLRLFNDRLMRTEAALRAIGEGLGHTDARLDALERTAASSAAVDHIYQFTTSLHRMTSDFGRAMEYHLGECAAIIQSQNAVQEPAQPQSHAPASLPAPVAAAAAADDDYVAVVYGSGAEASAARAECGSE